MSSTEKDNSGQSTTSWAIGAVTSRTNQLLVLFLAAFILTSIFSTTSVISALVFGSSVAAPANSLGDKVQQLRVLGAREAELYPNTSTLAESQGVICDSTRSERILEGLTGVFAAAANSARTQTDHFLLTHCLASRLPTSAGGCAEPSVVPSPKDLREGPAATCRATTEDALAWDECFLPRLEVALFPNCTQADLRPILDECKADFNVPLPFPIIPDASEEVLKSQLLQRVKSRAEYDRQYVATKLSAVSEWVDDMTTYVADVLDYGVEVDAFKLRLQEFQVNVTGFKRDVELAYDATKEQLAATYSHIENLAGEINVARIEFDGILLGARANFLNQVRQVPPVFRSFATAGKNVVNTIIAVASTVSNIISNLSLPGPGFNFGLTSGLTNMFTRLPLIPKDLPNVLDLNWPTPSLDAPSIPDFPTPDLPGPFPTLEIDFPVLPDPPNVDLSLFEWYGDDYNPPDVFNEATNRTIAASFVTPEPAMEAESADYNRTAVVAPELDTEINYPDLDATLAFLFLLDTISVIFDTVRIILRLRVRWPAAYKAKRSIGISVSGVDTGAAKRKLREGLIRCLSCCSPGRCCKMNLFIAYTVFLMIYAQVFFDPVNTDESFVYSAAGVMTVVNNVYDFQVYNRFNSELTSITNVCAQSRATLATTVLTVEESVASNITRIPIWVNEVLSNYTSTISGATDWTPDTSEYSIWAPEVEEFAEDGTDLCECKQLAYFPYFFTERQAVAQQSDSQLWIIANSYVLKAHFLVGLVLLMRYARNKVLDLMVLTLSRYSPARVHLVVEGPVNLVRGETPDYTAEYKAYIRKRTRRTITMGATVVAAYLALILVLSWNNRVDQQLYGTFTATPLGCATDGDCEDDDLCTTNTCDARTSKCVLTTTVCSDDDPCTADTCDSEIGCIFTAVECPEEPDEEEILSSTLPAGAACFENAALCDDDDACTRDTCDYFLGCVHEVVSCNDNNNCTVATCDPLVGCVFEPVECDDGNACTSDTCSSTTGCVFTPITCDDGDACTDDVCNPSTGCEFPVTTSCDDGLDCTIDECVDGVCTNIEDNSFCADGDPCTTDVCDSGNAPGTGCDNDPIALCTDSPMDYCDIFTDLCPSC